MQSFNVEEARQQLFQFLSDALKIEKVEIEARTKSHPEAHTVEEWFKYAPSLFPNAKLCKNLFLRDKKKGTIWLVVALWDTEVDMKALTKKLGFSSGTLRFAPEEILFETLKVRQGSVTPLALYFDKDKRASVVIDQRMVESDENILLFHPLTNDLSTKLSAKELKLFLQACGHQVNFLDFSTIKF